MAAVDALYIALASFGIATQLERQGVRTALKYLGAGSGSFLAGLGSLTQRFLPVAWRDLLNALVGCVLVFLAARMLLRRAGG